MEQLEVRTKMANKIIVAIFFFLMINVSANLLVEGVTNSDGEKVFESSSVGYVFSGESKVENFSSEMQDSVKIMGTADESDDMIYQIMDSMSLGFIYKFVVTVNNYLYGFIEMMDALFGEYLEPPVRSMLFGNTNNEDLIPNNFGILKLIAAIGYLIFSIQVLTGRQILS